VDTANADPPVREREDLAPLMAYSLLWGAIARLGMAQVKAQGRRISRALIPEGAQARKGKEKRDDTESHNLSTKTGFWP
jgi:hypothetical protein